MPVNCVSTFHAFGGFAGKQFKNNPNVWFYHRYCYFLLLTVLLSFGIQGRAQTCDITRFISPSGYGGTFTMTAVGGGTVLRSNSPITYSINETVTASPTFDSYSGSSQSIGAAYSGNINETVSALFVDTFSTVDSNGPVIDTVEAKDDVSATGVIGNGHGLDYGGGRQVPGGSLVFVVNGGCGYELFINSLIGGVTYTQQTTSNGTVSFPEDFINWGVFNQQEVQIFPNPKPFDSSAVYALQPLPLSGSAITGNVTLEGTNAQGFPVTMTATWNLCPLGAQCGPASVLSISTSSLSDGTVNTNYKTQTKTPVDLTATNGTPPYTWSLTSGALPNGLSLDGTTGTIAGTPTKAGIFSFTVQVNDSNGGTATKPLSITIVAPAPQADLSVVQNIAGAATTTGVPFVYDGTQITITVRVSNAGPDTAAEVVLKENMPVSSKLLNCQIVLPQKPCSNVQQGIDLGDMPSGQALEVHMLIQVLGSGPLRTPQHQMYVAKASAATNDPNLGNNTASTPLTVKSGFFLQPPILRFTKGGLSNDTFLLRNLGGIPLKVGPPLVGFDTTCFFPSYAFEIETLGNYDFLIDFSPGVLSPGQSLPIRIRFKPHKAHCKETPVIEQVTYTASDGAEQMLKLVGTF